MSLWVASGLRSVWSIMDATSPPDPPVACNPSRVAPAGDQAPDLMLDSIRTARRGTVHLAGGRASPLAAWTSSITISTNRLRSAAVSVVAVDPRECTLMASVVGSSRL